MCINAFVARWNGTQYQTGSTRLVGIKKDVHVAAFYLHPAMVPVDGNGRMIVAQGDRAAVGRVFARFFTQDEAGNAKTIALLQEFDLYTAGEGVWSEPLIEVRTEADILVNAMYRDSGVEPPECPLIQKVHRLTLAPDPRLWHGQQRHASPIWLYICNRICSMDPASVGPERMNKHYKTVVTSSRASMNHERSVKALYVYANLRFLMGIDDTDDKLMDLLDIAKNEISLEEALKKESKRVLTIPDPVINSRQFSSISEKNPLKRDAPVKSALTITGCKIAKQHKPPTQAALTNTEALFYAAEP